MPETQMGSASEMTRAVQTEVRTPAEGLTLITTLLETVGDTRTYYSLSVALCTNEPCGADARLITDITGERGTAEHLLRMIADGAVTPCTLADVLEDAL